MKNIIKNVIRSFKNNKLSIIGLVLLLFFGLGVFCVMSNTTSNITNEYTSLANKGNLHDFTVAELYDVGKADYLANNIKAIKYTRTTVEGEAQYSYEKVDNIGALNPKVGVSQFFFGNELSTTDGTFYIPLPQQQLNSDTGVCTRTYYLALDPDLSNGLYSDYAKNHAGTGFVNFKYTVTNTYEDIPGNVRTLQNALDNWSELSELDSLCVSSVFSDDYHNFNDFVVNKTSTIYSLMKTGQTPLANEIDKKHSNEVDYRYFKSINITATKDNIFYKIINSNPEDTIDKMVLFSDPNGRRGNYLYSEKDWSPYDSNVEFVNENGEKVEAGIEIHTSNDSSFVVPADFNRLAEMPLYSISDMNSWSGEEANLAKYIYSQIIQIRFKRMLAGDFSSDKSPKSYIEQVAAINTNIKSDYYQQLFDAESAIYSNYNNYLNDWYNGQTETIDISANGNVVLSWTSLLGVPSTLTISNWTSKMAIVNPQHLEKTSKRVISPNVLNDFKPFTEWYKQTFGSYPNNKYIDSSAAKKWFNTLSSSQYSWWINPNTKKEAWASMEYKLPDGESILMQRGGSPDQWNGINQTYLASCGGYDEIIWGCGLTPDFMYPVVDISHPTPNTTTECLVYTNDSGYFSIKLAFINSSVEEYLIGKFKSGVNPSKQNEILSEINKWATGPKESKDDEVHMIYPIGTQVAFFADDTSNVLNCSGFRIAYIPNLVDMIQTVSTILCLFVGILCAIICFVIIKRYVENNRISIGIMRANGIKKWKIALSLFPFALLPAIIGGIAAYLVGLFMQPPMLLLFSNYWMLPTPLISFSILPFLICIFAPFALFTLICFISAFVVLRTNTVRLMKAGSEFKANSFSRIAKKPFKHFGILTRFRVSLAFNSITRLLILGAMSCLTMSSLVFAMATFDKLNQSKNINSTQFDYDFNIELTTPSSSGGPYSVYDYSQPLSEGSDQIVGYGASDWNQYLFNVEWDTTDDDYSSKPWHTTHGEQSYKNLIKPYISSGFISGDENYMDTIGNDSLLLLPSSADQIGQLTDPMYLQNKRSSRLTLNYEIGIPGVASSNPWEIALALMPSNSRNLAADAFNELTNVAGHKVAEATKKFIEKAKELGLKVNDDGTITDWIKDIEDKVRQAESYAGSWCKINFANWVPPVTEPHYYSVYSQFFNYDKATDAYTLITDIGTVGTLVPTKFNTDFISLISRIYHDPELLKMEYPISYGGSLPLNWDSNYDSKKDETYTYITGNIKSLSSKTSFDSNHELKIEGIKEDTNYIHLTDIDGHPLNDRLWSNNYLQFAKIDNNNTYPIIINAYAAHKYRLGYGDTITINITNDVDRYISNFSSDDNITTFKVVGVSAGTNNEAFYTRQDCANNIIGLPNGQSWNRTHKYMMWSRNINSEWKETAENTLPSLVDLSDAWVDPMHPEDYGKAAIYHFNDNTQFKVDDEVDEKIDSLTSVKIPVGFNGIYTHNKTGKPITNGLSLYSYTGLYPGTSVFKSQGSKNKFKDLLSFGPNFAIASIMTGIDTNKCCNACQEHLENKKDISTEIDEFIDKVIEIYGSTTMITCMCGATDVAATDLIYNNLISTFNLAETTIMSIIIPITIIIVTVISSLIVNDSKRMAAMLKALGYSDIKNLISILALFVPTIILGVALAIPLALGLTTAYQTIIFNSANILVDITQKWWYYIVAIGGIGVILIGSYGIGYASLKHSRLIDQIK